MEKSVQSVTGATTLLSLPHLRFVSDLHIITTTKAVARQIKRINALRSLTSVVLFRERRIIQKSKPWKHRLPVSLEVSGTAIWSTVPGARYDVCTEVYDRIRPMLNSCIQIW